MAKRNSRNTRGRIVSAAWQLFYEQGYEHTTVEEIIEASQTSKGSFYHYFDGKDALLSTLSDLFDEKYEALMETMDPAMPALDQLLFLLQDRKSSFYHPVLPVGKRPHQLALRLLVSFLKLRYIPLSALLCIILEGLKYKAKIVDQKPVQITPVPRIDHVPQLLKFSDKLVIIV